VFPELPEEDPEEVLEDPPEDVLPVPPLDEPPPELDEPPEELDSDAPLDPLDVPEVPLEDEVPVDEHAVARRVQTMRSRGFMVFFLVVMGGSQQDRCQLRGSAQTLGRKRSLQSRMENP
jgi:hypothetical protein